MIKDFTNTRCENERNIVERNRTQEKKQADPISADDENILWEKDLLGGATLNSLLNTVFYYNYKLFGLRGLDEHRSRTRDQFSFKMP